MAKSRGPVNICWMYEQMNLPFSLCSSFLLLIFPPLTVGMLQKLVHGQCPKIFQSFVFNSIPHFHCLKDCPRVSMFVYLTNIILCSSKEKAPNWVRSSHPICHQLLPLLFLYFFSAFCHCLSVLIQLTVIHFKLKLSIAIYKVC